MLVRSAAPRDLPSAAVAEASGPRRRLFSFPGSARPGRGVDTGSVDDIVVIDLVADDQVRRARRPPPRWSPRRRLAAAGVGLVAIIGVGTAIVAGGDDGSSTEVVYDHRPLLLPATRPLLLAPGDGSAVTRLTWAPGRSLSYAIPQRESGRRRG